MSCQLFTDSNMARFDFEVARIRKEVADNTKQKAISTIGSFSKRIPIYKIKEIVNNIMTSAFEEFKNKMTEKYSESDCKILLNPTSAFFTNLKDCVNQSLKAENQKKTVH